MTSSTRETILFWCQVGLFVSAMLLLLGLLVLSWYFITAQVRTLEENRSRDKAMLQQHYEAMRDHEAVMERLRR